MTSEDAFDDFKADDATPDDAAPAPATDGTPGGAIQAILTPLPKAKPVAALCSLYGIKARTLETSAGVLAILDSTEPEALEAASAYMSQATKEMPLLSMERRDGQITIWRYTNGVRGAKVAPGLALAEAPGVISTLMSGAQSFDEIAATHGDKVADAHMGRFAAFRELRRLAKEAKRHGRDS